MTRLTRWRVSTYGPRGARILGDVHASDHTQALAAAHARWPGKVLWVTSYKELEERAAGARDDDSSRSAEPGAGSSVPQVQAEMRGDVTSAQFMALEALLEPAQPGRAEPPRSTDLGGRLWFILGGATAVVLPVSRGDTDVLERRDHHGPFHVFVTVGADGTAEWTAHGLVSFTMLGDIEAPSRAEAEAIARQRFPDEPICVMSREENRQFIAALRAGAPRFMDLDALLRPDRGV